METVTAARPLGAGERSDFVARVARIASEVARVHADDVDRQARFPAEALAALRSHETLSVLVPRSLGGPELPFAEVVAMCEVLAQHCAATAMVFAMHQIQVACLVRHGMNSPQVREYLSELVRKQYLIASVTSEVGVGGDMRRSVTALA